MPRREELDARLVNWARWKLGGGDAAALGYSAISLGAAVNAGRSGYVSAPVPVLSADAQDVDSAVNALRPLGLKLTVTEFYCGRGGVVDKAARLACSVPTVYVRLGAAHDQIAEHLAEKERARRAERDRVERLQRKGSFTR